MINQNGKKLKIYTFMQNRWLSLFQNWSFGTASVDKKYDHVRAALRITGLFTLRRCWRLGLRRNVRWNANQFFCGIKKCKPFCQTTLDKKTDTV
jgi:hypothetical protein